MHKQFDDLVDDIARQLEEGAPPWRRPWSLGGDPAEPLRADGLPFSGSNAWTLACRAALQGYASPYWFTFQQALRIEAPVRRGERASPAIFYRAARAQKDGDEASDARQTRPILRAYSVFNAEQLETPPSWALAAPPVEPELRLQARVAALEAVPARVELGGVVACYAPRLDLIRLPPPERFESLAEYHATWAHELAHWTGATGRLARDFGVFGDQAYAFEELVAELAAMLIGLRLGLPPAPLGNHLAYLGHWARLLTDRPALLQTASAHAQRAVDLLLSFSAPRPSPVAPTA